MKRTLQQCLDRIESEINNIIESLKEQDTEQARDDLKDLKRAFEELKELLQ